MLFTQNKQINVSQTNGIQTFNGAELAVTFLTTTFSTTIGSFQTRNLVDSSLSGLEAIEQLLNASSTDLSVKSVKRGINKSSVEVLSLFLRDKNARLDTVWEGNKSSHKVFYLEEAPNLSSDRRRHLEERHGSRDHKLRATTTTSTFALHSRPGASKVIYLDFNGHNVSNTAWNSQYSTIIAPPFDTDGNPSAFSASELSIITQVWQRVSEDYAPFEIDVTTEYAGSEDFLTRSNASDVNYGVRVLISPISRLICSTCGGISYVGVFADIGPSFLCVVRLFLQKIIAS